jgi:hypothetical protein
MWSGYGSTLQGWALSQRGVGEAAIERIRAGLAATKETEARNWEPFCLGLLAEALAMTGKIEEGLLVLAEALEMANTSGQTGTNAELYRLRGDRIYKIAGGREVGVRVFPVYLLRSRLLGALLSQGFGGLRPHATRLPDFT